MLYNYSQFKISIILRKGIEVENNSFIENIKIKTDKDEARILRLQKEYKIGKINEKDISDEDYKKLIVLYEKQNKKIKEKIDVKKKKIRKKLEELKK